MNTKNFQRLHDMVQGKADSLLKLKTLDYAPIDDERLQNFKDAALIEKRTPAEYCYSLMIKHFLAMGNMAKDNPKELCFQHEDGREGPLAKGADMINYVHLFFACLADEEGASVVE